MYRFGPFEFDLRSHELRRDYARLKIPEQCFTVLRKLVEHPGELVTRDELRKAVWPAETFVDFDTGLNKIVKLLPRSWAILPTHPPTSRPCPSSAIASSLRSL